MTERKFYKTIIPLEFLSEEPIGTQEISNLIEEAMTGCLSMRILENQETILNGKETADALAEQGSDSGFFNLTDCGDDAD